MYEVVEEGVVSCTLAMLAIETRYNGMPDKICGLEVASSFFHIYQSMIRVIQCAYKDSMSCW